jgi:hypothetical protein
MFGGAPSNPASKRTIGFDEKRARAMLYAIAGVLLLIWLLGFVTAHTVGGFLHFLPVIAIEIIVLQAIVGEDPA